MIAIFRPYHSLSNVDLFLNTFNGLKNRQKVAQSAIGIPRYCISVVNKLVNAKDHLENILSVEEWVTTTASLTNASTISTFSTTHVAPPTFGISGNLDNFFGNLSSAFDIFAQVVNLVYLAPPLDEKDVSFEKIINEMGSKLQNEQMTQHLTSLRTMQWYVDMKPFRNCGTHRKTIRFKVLMEEESMRTLSWPKVTTILLPDDPFIDPPTYNTNREMEVFGLNIFENTLNQIDEMYGMMEVRVRVTDRIPV